MTLLRAGVLYKHFKAINQAINEDKLEELFKWEDLRFFSKLNKVEADILQQLASLKVDFLQLIQYSEQDILHLTSEESLEAFCNEKSISQIHDALIKAQSDIKL